MPFKLNSTYISAGCNRSPNCLAWRGDVLLYASADSIVVASTSDVCPDALVARSTLCGHAGRVNCVRWLEGGEDADMFVTASADGTSAVWNRKGKSNSYKFERTKILRGHTRAVTVASAISIPAGVLMATASADCSIRIWRLDTINECDDTNEAVSVLDLGRGLCNDVRLAAIDESCALMFAATEDCAVRIYAGTVDSGVFELRHALRGHDDWVRSLDVARLDGGRILLASGGQDGFVRVWKMTPEKNVIEDDGGGDLTMKEVTVQVGQHRLTVSLETVLAGHEDKVFGVQWRKSPSLNLFTSSMDKTMIVWAPPPPDKPDNNNDNEDQLWSEAVRLGDVGGNTLGFIGAQFDPCGGHNAVMGYSFSGALHSWREDPRGGWRSAVQLGGHSDRAVDLDWAAGGGEYLLSAGADQTTRVHAPWRPQKQGQGSIWRECARPQVHGHDLACLCSMPGHRLSSGSEEKVLRVFEATASFLDNLESICGLEVSSSEEKARMAQGASVPSLGLSNKAVLEEDKVIPEMERHVKDQYPDHYFKPETYLRPPPEEALAQNTLWPERQKLYGHGYEVFAVSTDGAEAPDTLLASSCKASKAEHAEVLLWRELDGEWRVAQRLRAHNLTVTQMAFSPCGLALLTASRDRTWALFEKDKESGLFTLSAKTDKATAVHQRLIWSCAWSPDSLYFATASRDKKVAIWRRRCKDSSSPSEMLACLKPFQATESVTAVAVAPIVESNSCYLLALGTEGGRIILLQWNPKAEEDTSEWSVLDELSCDDAHHKTVTRLKFRPHPTDNEDKNREMLLASCGADGAVKIFKVSRT